MESPKSAKTVSSSSRSRVFVPTALAPKPSKLIRSEATKVVADLGGRDYRDSSFRKDRSMKGTKESAFLKTGNFLEIEISRKSSDIGSSTGDLISTSSGDVNQAPRPRQVPRLRLMTKAKQLFTQKDIITNTSSNYGLVQSLKKIHLNAGKSNKLSAKYGLVEHRPKVWNQEERYIKKRGFRPFAPVKGPRPGLIDCDSSPYGKPKSCPAFGSSNRRQFRFVPIDMAEPEKFNPGPGKYVNEPEKPASTAMMQFPNAIRFSKVRHNAPGVGAYNLCRDKNWSKLVSSPFRNKMQRLRSATSTSSPGPGMYSPKSGRSQSAIMFRRSPLPGFRASKARFTYKAPTPNTARRGPGLYFDGMKLSQWKNSHNVAMSRDKKVQHIWKTTDCAEMLVPSQGAVKPQLLSSTKTPKTALRNTSVKSLRRKT
eukprot:jgi/Bigna1/91857/estExt_fgenesh1_pg.C_1250016